MAQKANEDLLKTLCEQAAHEQDGKKLVEFSRNHRSAGRQETTTTWIANPANRLTQPSLRFSQFGQIVIVSVQLFLPSSNKKRASVRRNSAW
jgi:hypothetical protein